MRFQIDVVQRSRSASYTETDRVRGLSLQAMQIGSSEETSLSDSARNAHNAKRGSSFAVMALLRGARMEKMPPCPRILKSLDPNTFDGDGFLEVRRSAMRNFKNYFDLVASRAGIPFKPVILDRPKYRLEERMRSRNPASKRVIRRALGVPHFIVPSLVFTIYERGDRAKAICCA
ncbi:uncharacterized protein LOC113566650 isoform X2 [Drosophila persimilis]|uniref:uncharacterized protein LOC113566650 isoform X2 n=1 Tax=Drosophila persimilis TaxID=7234 RepID=UPI000F09882C|nr:uncharacterized protein LOC113566650 isoform X2 [Drosophila persimilis]